MQDRETPPPRPRPRFPLALKLATAAGLIGSLWVPALSIGVAALWAGAFHHARRRHERERDDLRLRSELAERELRRSQDARRRLDIELNPHFVFSSLHAVSALMGRDAVGANRVLSLLGEVIRGALVRKESEDVALEEEIAALVPILEIEHVRFGDRLRVVWEVGEAALDARLPPRLLHALIEFMIQHASVRPGAPRVLTIRGAREGERLALRITDPSVTALDTRPQPVGPGTDYVAVAERLAQIYGTAHTLHLHASPDDGASITLSLPWRDEAELDPNPRILS